MGRFADAVEAGGAAVCTFWAKATGARTKASTAKIKVLRIVFSYSRGNHSSFSAKQKFTPLTALPCRGLLITG
jgi:hypothetical protein